LGWKRSIDFGAVHQGVRSAKDTWAEVGNFSGFLTFNYAPLDMATDSQPYLPPFARVRLLECRDCLVLAPVAAFQELFAYGRIRTREAMVEVDGKLEPFWDDAPEDEECWAVVQWTRFENGRQVEGMVQYIREPTTEDEVRKAMEDLRQFYSLSREELLQMARCFRGNDGDYDYIESRHPNYQSPPADPKDLEALDLYQARLKVLAGLQPKTVDLIRRADAETDPGKRQRLEREAVQAYFAELAHHWTEDQVLAWQRSNPVGTAWLCEFSTVFQEAPRELDPINHELALNWLRRKYNLLTAEELSDAILVATLQRLTPEALKKRRERLGLTTRRKPGAPSK
jgi:hypothetical protein